MNGRGDRIRTYDLYVPKGHRRGKVHRALADLALRFRALFANPRAVFATEGDTDSERPRRQRRRSALFPQGEQDPPQDPFPGPPAPPPTQADRDLMSAYSTTAWIALAVIVGVLTILLLLGVK